MNPYALLFFLAGFVAELAFLYDKIEREVFFRRLFKNLGTAWKKAPAAVRIGLWAVAGFVIAGALASVANIRFPGTEVYGSLSEGWVAMPFTAAGVVFFMMLLFDARIMPRITEPALILIIVPFWQGLITRGYPWPVLAAAGVATVAVCALVLPRRTVPAAAKMFLYLFYLMMVAACSFWYFPHEYVSASRIDPAGALILGSAFVYFGIHWSVLLRFFVVTLSVWRKQNRELALSFVEDRFSNEQQRQLTLVLSFVIMGLTVPASLLLTDRTLQLAVTAAILIALQLPLVKRGHPAAKSS